MRTTRRRLTVVLSGLVAIGCARQPSAENSGSPPGADTPSVPAPAGPDLRSTRWQLVALGDKPVTVADGQRTPHIILQAGSKQMSGSGGCNRMFGVYELNGEALRFSGVGSTKMACPGGMDIESAFLPALLKVAKWRIVGQQLELSDSTGAVLARFAAATGN
jgi:putative lipoprotein